MMGRGLGYFTGALRRWPATRWRDSRRAEHDLERAVFLDPKLLRGAAPARRALPARRRRRSEGRARARPAKFNYAADLAPDDIASLRAAALAPRRARQVRGRARAVRASSSRGGRGISTRATSSARRCGSSATPQAPSTSSSRSPRTQPDHLAGAPRARADPRVAQRHAEARRRARGDRGARARRPRGQGRPRDRVRRARPVGPRRSRRSRRSRRRARPISRCSCGSATRTASSAISTARSPGTRARGKLAPESSLPGLRDGAGAVRRRQARRGDARVHDAAEVHATTCRPPSRRSARSRSLQDRADDAAWYLRRAAREAPRSLPTRRALIAAELAAQGRAGRARAARAARSPAWPHDGDAALPRRHRARARRRRRDAARAELAAALERGAGLAAGARRARRRSTPAARSRSTFKPELVRPWGDGDALQAALDRYARDRGDDGDACASTYQAHVLALLGALGAGPQARVEAGRGADAARSASSRRRGPPRSRRSRATSGSASSSRPRIASSRATTRSALTAGLLPNARTAVAAREEELPHRARRRRRAARRVDARPRPRAARGRLQRRAARRRGRRSGALPA